MGGKILVSIQEHIDRLKAARLQADIMENELIIIARTDSESARYLENNSDERDHPFILGTLRFQTFNNQWKEVEECTFSEAIKIILEHYNEVYKWKQSDYQCGYKEALYKAKKLINKPFIWDWEILRSKEGYYKIKGGVEYSIHRCLAFAPYAGFYLKYKYFINNLNDLDLLWMETQKPDLKQAIYFAKE